MNNFFFYKSRGQVEIKIVNGSQRISNFSFELTLVSWENSTIGMKCSLIVLETIIVSSSVGIDGGK